MDTISDAEWEVMRVVWANGDMKSSEVIAILHAKYHWSDSTVKTLIGRLVKKKALRADRQGRSYIYQSLLDQDRLELAILRERLDGMCQRHHSHLLLALLKETPMTLEDIQDFQVLLEAKAAQAVPDVLCHCLPGQCYCQKKEKI